MAQVFYAMGQHDFPNIIGAIDSCHVHVSQPLQQPTAFYKCKRFHSIILQAVCAPDCMFTDVSVGCPDCCHDSRAFQKSNLYDTGLARCGMGECHIICNGVYPLKRWVMTLSRYRQFISRSAKVLSHCQPRQVS